MEKETEGFSIAVEDVGPCKKRVAIEVPGEKIKGALEKRLQEVGSTANVPGFRRGRVPRSVLERHFGEQIEEEVKKSLIWDAYQEAVNRNQLEPLGSPELGEIKFDPKDSLKFTVTLEVKPTFEAKDYRGMKLQRRSTAVTKEETESALKNLSLSKVHLVTEETSEVQGGDQVICDYKVLVDGNVVHQDEEVVVWVSGGMLADIPAPELLVALKGAKPGEKREAKANLGAKFRLPEYRNKEASLEIIVREIKRPKAPEINDELAKQFGAPSLDELRKNVQKRLGIDKKRWVEEDLQAQVYQKLVNMAGFELPKDLVEEQTGERLYRYKIEMLQRGIPMEELEKEAEKLKNTSHEMVVRDLKLSLVMDNIADKEKIYVTEQEVEKRIQEMALVYQTTTIKMRRELDKYGSLSSLRYQMKESKVMDLILKEAEIEDEKVEEKQEVENRESVKEKQKG